MCRANGTLLLVDTVCSLGGVPLYADDWAIDAIYSGSQKCLSAPPGAAPLMLNERAMQKLKNRKTKVRGGDGAMVVGWWLSVGLRSWRRGGCWRWRAAVLRLAACVSCSARVHLPTFSNASPRPDPPTHCRCRRSPLQVRSYYLDLNLVGDYWGWFGGRSYHHTGLVSMWYAMREALAIVSEEGLVASWARHEAVHKQLWEGLTAMGLEPYVANPEHRLVTVNTIKVPAGVDWAALCKNAMDKYNVEIAGGLGPTAGKIFRVGLMGGWWVEGVGVGAVEGGGGEGGGWGMPSERPSNGTGGGSTFTCALEVSSCPHLHSILCPALPAVLAGYNAKPGNVELVLAAFRDGLQQQGFLKH